VSDDIPMSCDIILWISGFEEGFSVYELLYWFQITQCHLVSSWWLHTQKMWRTTGTYATLQLNRYRRLTQSSLFAVGLLPRVQYVHAVLFSICLREEKTIYCIYTLLTMW
jgi:hypothetical protein